MSLLPSFLQGSFPAAQEQEPPLTARAPNAENEQYRVQNGYFLLLQAQVLNDSTRALLKEMETRVTDLNDSLTHFEADKTAVAERMQEAKTYIEECMGLQQKERSEILGIMRKEIEIAMKAKDDGLRRLLQEMAEMRAGKITDEQVGDLLEQVEGRVQMLVGKFESLERRLGDMGKELEHTSSELDCTREEVDALKDDVLTLDIKVAHCGRCTLTRVLAKDGQKMYWTNTQPASETTFKDQLSRASQIKSIPSHLDRNINTPSKLLHDQQSQKRPRVMDIDECQSESSRDAVKRRMRRVRSRPWEPPAGTNVEEPTEQEVEDDEL